MKCQKAVSFNGEVSHRASVNDLLARDNIFGRGAVFHLFNWIKIEVKIIDLWVTSGCNYRSLHFVSLKHERYQNKNLLRRNNSHPIHWQGASWAFSEPLLVQVSLLRDCFKLFRQRFTQFCKFCDDLHAGCVIAQVDFPFLLNSICAKTMPISLQLCHCFPPACFTSGTSRQLKMGKDGLILLNIFLWIRAICS